MASGGDAFIIVAAIDFGTAYSGYAFSFRHTFQEDPTKVSTNSWPAGTGSLLSLKTSTCALFDPKKKFHSFGFEAEDKYSDLALDHKHTDWYFFKHFKMDLFEKVKLNRGFKIEDTLGRTMPALDIFSNAIGYLKKHLFKTCRDKIPDTREEDIRWVLTVPAIWDDAAKQFMREAASKAGIGDAQLLIALEPEAASLYCKYLPIDKLSGADGGFTPFLPGSKYMVLDAGGGTVDITVHEVKDDFSLSEIYKASGGNWGGTYVDKAFKTFLSNIIGNNVMAAFVKEQTLDYVELFRSFEVKKRSFQSRVTEKVMFKVPVSMNETHVAMKKKNIKDILQATQYAGQISWTGDKVRISADIVNSFFDEPCEKLVKHLQKLFTNPDVDDVDFILMVGGFSESLLLQEYVKNAFPDKRVIVPNEASLAVLKGAVIFGHDTKGISERKAKYTYGVDTMMPFKYGKHPEDKMKFTEDSDIPYCEDIFHAHVQIGSTIKTGEAQVTKSYNVSEKDQEEFTFFVYASKKRRPKFVTDPGCILIGTLSLDAPGYGLDRSAEVHLMFGDTELHVHAVNAQTGEEESAKFDFLSGDGDHDSGSDSSSDNSDSDSDNSDVAEHIGESFDDQAVLDFLCFESDYDDYESSDEYSD